MNKTYLTSRILKILLEKEEKQFLVGIKDIEFKYW